jgi:HD domain.
MSNSLFCPRHSRFPARERGHRHPAGECHRSALQPLHPRLSLRAEQGRQQKLRFDAELLYVAAAFHDLGLLKKFSSPDERFEVDGANAARQFLAAHDVPEERIQTVWEAIALHTTPGIPPYMRPEVAVLYSGVLLDVLGRGYDQFPAELRDEILASYPRKHFKEDFIPAYVAGFAHKPATTYGTVNAAVCERYIPGFKSPNACDLIAALSLPGFGIASSSPAQNRIPFLPM